jgi:hypothetical protein
VSPEVVPIRLQIRHGGVLPGITTQILRVPSLGVGLMLAIEDTDFALPLVQVVVNRLLDDMMGLEPINWEDIMMTKHFKEEPEERPLITSPRPAPPAEAVTGQYQDPAYGLIDIQRVPAIHSTISTYLPAVSDELAAVIRAALKSSRVEQIDVNRETYYAALPRLWTQGLIFTHFDGPLINVSIVMIQDKVDTGKPISRILGKGTAVFVEGKGVGMFEGFWSGIESRTAVEEDVESLAEVWFNRVIV